MDTPCRRLVRFFCGINYYVCVDAAKVAKSTCGRGQVRPLLYWVLWRTYGLWRRMCKYNNKPDACGLGKKRSRQSIRLSSFFLQNPILEKDYRKLEVNVSISTLENQSVKWAWTIKLWLTIYVILYVCWNYFRISTLTQMLFLNLILFYNLEKIIYYTENQIIIFKFDKFLFLMEISSGKLI